MLKTITYEKSAQLCKAEHSLLYLFEGGCQIDMCVSATLDEDMLTLNSTVLSNDGKESVHGALEAQQSRRKSRRNHVQIIDEGEFMSYMVHHTLSVNAGTAATDPGAGGYSDSH